MAEGTRDTERSTVSMRVLRYPISYIPMTLNLSRLMTKPTKWVCTQRSLRSAWASAQVWSESSLSAWRKLGSLDTHSAHSEDSDLTGRMPRLIWVFAGRTVILLVLSWCGSFYLIMEHRVLAERILNNWTTASHGKTKPTKWPVRPHWSFFAVCMKKHWSLSCP